MIWHDHIATHRDVVFRTRSDCEVYQCCIHRIRCQEFCAPMRAECDKEQRIVGKDASESRWEPWIIAHEFLRSRVVAAHVGAAALGIETKEKSLRTRLALRTAKRLEAAEVGSRRCYNPCSRPLWAARRPGLLESAHRASHSEAATGAKGVQVASGGYRVAGEKDQRKLKKA